MAYANGRIPASFLVQAANGAPGQVLEPQTAMQWTWMVAGADRDGVRLQPEPDNGIPSCYRSLEAQQTAWNDYISLGGARAATPGYSNHGFGKAVDILITTATLAWLRANAARYGFDNAEGANAGENWHWVCTKTITINPDQEEDDMNADQAQKLDDLWQAVLPGQAGRKTQGAIAKQIADTYTTVQALGADTTSKTLLAKVTDLWQRLLPGTAGVKVQGDVAKQLADTLTAVNALSEKVDELAAKLGK